MSDETTQNEQEKSGEKSEDQINYTAMPIKDLLTLCLNQVEASQEIDAGAFLRLKLAYGKCLNNSPCACESGRAFANCCKVDWTIVLRGFSAIKEEKREERKEEIQAGSLEVTWVCKVGITKKNGFPTILPVDDGKDMNPFGIANLLLDAYMHANNRALIEHMMVLTEKRLTGREPNMGNPPIKLITH
jgi:hypothetical protein